MTLDSDAFGEAKHGWYMQNLYWVLTLLEVYSKT